MNSGTRTALRSVLGIAAIVAATGARGARVTPPASARPLPPPLVLARYAEALGAVKRPSALSFEYVVEQLGMRNLEQRHRVYRRGLDERDETFVVDGYTLSRPSVRIIRNRTYRYDVTQVAPRPAAYAFTYRGSVRAGNHFIYVFTAAAHASHAFAVSELAIDGSTYLPTVVRFKISGSGARGRGELAYGKSETFWVIQSAHVVARMANGTPARERITWLNYRFPRALPSSTFQAPRPSATELPAEPPADAPADSEL